MSYVFILGALDPEMTEIENILSQRNLEYRPATVDGKRVHPGNAYKADPIDIPEGAKLVLIECEPAGAQNFVRIDHHRPGDPGYGLPASEFWQASSLGQLWELLQLEGIAISPSQDQIVLAAMDHCPAHAIRGECPGVTAAQILNRKVVEIASKTGASAKEVQNRIDFMLDRLENAPEVTIGGQALKDLRAFDNGVGYNLDLLTSQVATLVSGYTVLLATADREGGAKKWTVAGHATPECIEAFKNEWGPAQGLTGIYGVPNRGYAGGYLPEEKAYCSNGCELSKEEIRWNAGLPGTDTLGVYCNHCDNAPCTDSMKVGWRGWKEPDEQQVNQFMASHGKGWN